MAIVVAISRESREPKPRSRESARVHGPADLEPLSGAKEEEGRTDEQGDGLGSGMDEADGQGSGERPTYEEFFPGEQIDPAAAAGAAAIPIAGTSGQDAEDEDVRTLALGLGIQDGTLMLAAGPAHLR